MSSNHSASATVDFSFAIAMTSSLPGVIHALGDVLSKYFVTGACLITGLAIIGNLLFAVLSKTGPPALGYPRWLGPYYGGLRFFFSSRKMIEEGYKKYKSGGVYKLPRWKSWLFVVTGDRLVQEFHAVPDDTLSLLDSANEEFQMEYTTGSNIHNNPYHVPILRVKLRRNIDYLVVETMEEVIAAFEETIGKQCDGNWKDVDVVEPMTKIMARTFNRIIVGAPLCRNESYLKVACQHAVDRFVIGSVINLSPNFLRPFVGKMLTTLPRIARTAMIHLSPVINERKSAAMEYGKHWSGKPNDVLSWFLDNAQGEEGETEDLTLRLLTVNSAAIHTSSLVFIHTLMNLATRLQYVNPLRQEAEDAVERHGWKKAAIEQLAQMDSFFKESIRLNGLGSVTFPRRALKAFTFSDGSYIPKGSYVAAPMSIHLDEDYYPDPYTFDGLRFYKDPGSSELHSEDDFPGRFIVAYVLKSLMSHILINYDIKMGGDGNKPPDFWFGYLCSTNTHVMVSFKRRSE